VPIDTQNFQDQAETAASVGDWKAAAEFYSRAADHRASELALINSVQEGLSSKLDMQGIYDLVGDKLRDTFIAQVVMISQYDPNTKKSFTIMRLSADNIFTSKVGNRWILHGQKSFIAASHL
jgi:hypothetical protein